MTYPGKAPIKLAGHFWFNSDARNAGRKCPAIVEFLPYRRRDGTMLADAKMYPWFAFNDYLCFRVDLRVPAIPKACSPTNIPTRSWSIAGR